MSNEESFYFILISGLILQIAPMALIIFTRNRVRENYTIHGYPSMYEPTTESFCYMAGGFCIFLGAAAAAILTLTDGGLKNNLIICFFKFFGFINNMLPNINFYSGSTLMGNPLRSLQSTSSKNNDLE